MMNAALREYVEHRREPLEDTVRRVLREELAQYPKKVRAPRQ